MHDWHLDLLKAGVAQLVEHFLAKEDVASSSLVARSIFPHQEVSHHLISQ